MPFWMNAYVSMDGVMIIARDCHLPLAGPLL